MPLITRSGPLTYDYCAGSAYPRLHLSVAHDLRFHQAILTMMSKERTRKFFRLAFRRAMNRSSQFDLVVGNAFARRISERSVVALTLILGPIERAIPISSQYPAWNLQALPG
jgi:hypothetical protein